LLFLWPRLPPARNGIGDYTAALAQELAADGTATGILTSIGPAEAPGVPVFSRLPDWSDRRLPEVIRQVRALRPRAVLWQYNPFAYGYKGLSAAYAFLPLLLRRAGIPVVVTVHEPFHPTFGTGMRGLVLGPAQRAGFAVVATSAAGCVATNAMVAAMVRGCRPGRGATVAQIPTGTNVLPVPFSAAERAAVRRTLGAGERTFLAGTFGTLATGQEVEIVLDALCRLGRDVDWRFVLLGDVSPQRGRGRRVAAAAARLGVADRLAWPGYLPAPEVSRRLHALDTVVALYDDGVSGRRTTAAAAFAHGRALLTNAGPATGERYVRHGETCWLSPLDAGAVGDALAHLAADADLRRRLGAGAAAAYERDLTWQAIGAGYRRLLDQIGVG
jgi:glycosyltransferase involved in cell wall biosynthesis